MSLSQDNNMAWTFLQGLRKIKYLKAISSILIKKWFYQMEVIINSY